MAKQPKAISFQQRQHITPRGLGIIALIFLCFLAGWLVTQFNPVIVFGIVGITILVALLFASPYIGVLIYLIFEYARVPAMFPALQALQIGKLIVVPTLLMLLVHTSITKSHKLVFDKVFYLLIFWFGLAVISAPLSDSPGVWGALLDLSKWFIICFLIVNLLKSLPKFQCFVWLLLLLNLKLSQHQIRSYYSGFRGVSEQYRDFFIHQGVGAGSSSFFANATDFGLAMVVVAPLVLFLIPSVRSKFLKIFACGTFIAFIISILKSGSRGAALAMFAMAALFWFKSKNKLIVLVALVIFVASFWSIAPAAWQDRFLSAEDYESDATAMQRIELWKAGIRMFANHPIFGVGVDQYGYEFENGYRPQGYRGASAAHSIFIQAAAELGVGGITVLLLILFILFKRNRETRQIYKRANLQEKWIWNFSLALDLSLLGFIVGGAFLTVLYYPHLYMILSMIISLHYITKEKAENIANSASFKNDQKIDKNLPSGVFISPSD